MLPEYHLYLLLLLFGLGLPVYLAVWLRRFSRAERGRGERPSPVVFFLFLIAAAAFIHHVALTGPFPMRARQFEAQRNLGRIYYLERDYRAAHGQYAAGEGAFAALGFQPVVRPKNYALFCGGDVFAPEQAPWLKGGMPSSAGMLPEGELGTSARMPMPPGDWPLNERPETSAAGYTCVAVGNIDWDGWPDVWTLNDSKRQTHHPTDLWPPEPGDFPDGPLFPDHPLLSRLDPGGFYFGSVTVTVLLPAALLAALGWGEWRQKKRSSGIKTIKED